VFEQVGLVRRAPKNWWRLSLLLTGLWFCGNCAPVARLPQQFNQVLSTPAASKQREYCQVLHQWTRSGRIYNQFDTELLLTATYRSLPFRRAYLRAYSRAYQLDEVGTQELLEEHKKDVGMYHEFLLAAFVPDAEWNDFAHPRSSWKLYLETGPGGRLAPVEIRRIPEVTPLISSFYPYVKPWDSVYTVRFAVGKPACPAPSVRPVDRTVSLLVTNPRGAVRLTWELHPETTAPSAPAE
jgi:hypothetical protein